LAAPDPLLCALPCLPQGRADAQEAAVRDVSGLLGVTPGSASLLLRRFKWHQEDLLSRYMEDPAAVCLDAGLPPPGSRVSAPTVSARAAPGSVCLICQEELEAGTATVSSLACGHAFCNGCWSTYLELKIQEGDIAIGCPQYKCRLRVPEEVVESLCPGEVALRFKAFLRNSYVDDSRTAAWCPHAGCTLAVDTGEGGFVTCGGGHTFCTACKHPDAHAPAPCALVRQWQIKCDDDSETMNWLHTHTQDCPQCKSTIEKNGGCNHMTCRSCQHQFCWVCAGPWAAHGDSYYSCSKYDAGAKASKESNVASSRVALERYLHHFHRFMNHDASRKLEASTRARAEATITALQVANPEAAQWGDVSFVQAGVECAMQCRQVLKWTYVLAFFLEDKSPPKELFCFAQAELEARTERLSGLLEKPAETLLQPAVRSEILALVGAATASRDKILRSAPSVEAPGGAAAAAKPAA
jgi:ariadne-1